MRSLRVSVLSALFFSAACSTNVPTDNPYDPRAPIDKQIKGAIIGSVVSDAAFDPALLVVTISGVTPTGDQVADVEVLLEPDGQVIRFTAEVPGGTFRLTASVPQFKPADRFGIVASPGETVDVGILQLEVGRGMLTGSVIARSPTTGDDAPPLDTRITLIRLVQPLTFGGATADCNLPGAEEAVTVPLRGDGTFLGTNLAAGPYLVTAERDGYVPAISSGTADVTVGAVVDSGQLILLLAEQMVRISSATDPNADPSGLATRTLDVTLDMAVPPLYNGMRVSEDVTFTDPLLGDSVFGPAQSTLAWTLPAGEGYRELFVQYRAPTCATSPVFAAGVIVDTTPPVAGVPALVSGESCTNDPFISIAITGNDPCATDLCAGLYQMQLATDGTLDTEAWVDFDSQYGVDVGGDGIFSTVVALRDRAGNSSAPVSSTLTVNSAGPQWTAPVLMFDGGAATVHSLIVELTFNVTNATEVEIGNFAGLDGSAWQSIPISGQVAWRMEEGPDGSRDTYLRFRDDCGNVTQEFTESVLLDRTARIRGSVRLKGQSNHAGITVSVWRLDIGSGIYVDTGVTVTSGSDGVFLATGLVAGTYRLDFSNSGFAARSQSGLIVTDGGELLLPEISLLIARGNLQGNVTLQGEDAHDGILVTAVAGEVTFTDANGDYLFSNLPVGQYLVSAEKGSAYILTTASGLTDLLEGQTAVAPAIVLPPIPGSISGTAQRLDPAADLGIDILVAGRSLNGTEQTASTITDNLGLFSITGLTAGTYTVTISSAAFKTVQLPSFVLSPAEAFDAGTTVLQPATGGVNGTVTLIGETQHSGVTVTLMQSSNTKGVTFTLNDGSYSFAEVVSGSYSITTTNDGFSTGSATSVIVQPELVTAVGLISMNPQVGSVSFVGVGSATNQTTVQITGEYPGATDARFCEDPAIQSPSGDPLTFTLADCPWEALSFTGGGPGFDPVSKSFKTTECPNPGDPLAICDGRKSFWVRIRDSGAVESNWFSLVVVLDRLPPSGNIVIEPLASTLAGGTVVDGGSSYTRSLSATILLTATEDLAGVAAGGAVAGVDAAEIYRTPTDAFPVIVPMSDGNKTLEGVSLQGGADGNREMYLILSDAAGNRSVADLAAVVCPDPRLPGVPTDCDSIFLDTTPPPALAYSINPTNTGGDLSIGDLWANSPIVQLGVDSTTTGLEEDEAVEALIANDPGFLGAMTQPLSQPRILLSWALASGEGTKWVYVKVRDRAGNLSARFDDDINLDATPPATPALISIAAYTNDATPTLLFGSVADAVSYGIQLSDDPSFQGGGAVSVDTTQPGTSYTAAALGDATYYWRVKAIDAAGLESPFSPAESFIVDTAPPALPTLQSLTSPTNDDTPALSWSSIADAVSYNVQLDTDTGFGSANLITASASTPTYTSGTLLDNTWYARVQAVDAAGNASPYGAGYITFLLDTAAPGNPTLVAPADAALIASANITIDWDPAAGATSYLLQVDSNSAMPNPGEYITTATQKLLPFADGSWTFRVGATDAAGNASDISVATKRTFTIDTIPPAIPVMNLVLTPGSDATPTLSWGSVGGATEYAVTIDGVSTTVTGTTHTPAALSEGSHSWSVASRDAAGNQSPGASTQSFVVDTTAPVGPTPVAFTPDPTNETSPTVSWGAVAGAASYKVEWDSLVAFTSADYASATTTGASLAIGPLSDGTWFWKVTAIDAVGNLSSPSSVSSFEVDGTLPFGVTATLTGKIADNVDSTTLTGVSSVTVDITATDTNIDAGAFPVLGSIWVSNDAAFSTGAWEDFVAQKTAWPIESGSGQRWVYVRVADEAGNIVVVSANIEADLGTPLLPAISIAQGSVTKSLGINLDLSAVDAQQMWIEGHILGTPAWIAYDITKAATLSSAACVAGLCTVSVKYRDAAGNETALVSDSITLDQVAPTSTVTIVGTLGDQSSSTTHTAGRDVTITLSTTDAVEMMVSNLSNLSDASWEPIRSNFSWALTAGDNANKKVYVELRDPAGNETGVPLEGIINLDTTPPATPTLVLATGSGYAQSSVGVSIDITTSGATEMRVALDGTLDGESWESFPGVPFSRNLLPAGEGDKVVQVTMRDAARNATPIVSAPITIDGSNPQIVRVTVGDGSGYVTTADGSTTVEVDCLDAPSLPSELALVIQESGVDLYNGPYLSIVDVTLGATEGAQTLTATCSDSANNSVTNNSAATVMVDHTAPVLTSFLLNGGAANERTKSQVVSAWVNLSDPYAGSILVSLAETATSCGAASYSYNVAHASLTKITITISAGDGIRNLYLCAQDAAGNTSASATAASNAIELDTVGPSTPGLQIADIGSDGFAISRSAIELAWTTPADGDLAGFDLDRMVVVNASSVFVALASFASTDVQYADNVTATVGDEHRYRIRAFDDLNNYSGWSTVSQGVPYDPVESVTWSRAGDLFQFEYSPNAGTFSVLPTHRYEQTSGQLLSEAISTNSTVWQRPQPLGTIFNETLLLRTSNQDNSLVQESEFALPFVNQKTIIDGVNLAGGSPSIAVDAQRQLHVSYFDTVATALRVAVGTPSSWTTSVVDNSANVGQFSSIALDSNEKLHISYYNTSSADLKYATNASGAWVLSTLDTGTASVGMHTSIAIDSADKVHISYYATSGLNLRYATNASGSWAYTTIYATGNVGEDTSIGIDSADKVHISYYDVTSENLRYATNKSGSWVNATVEAADTVGIATSLTIDGNDKVHLSYQKGGVQDLKYATNASGSWVTKVIDSGSGAGSKSSIAVTAGGEIRISYVAGGRLSLATAPAYNGTFALEVLDGGIVGDVDIALDDLQRAHIVYASSTGVPLRYVSYLPEDWQFWPKQLVAAASATGFTSMAVAVDNSGAAHISYKSGNYLQYATNRTGGWVVTTVDNSSSNVGRDSSIVADSSGAVHISYYQATGSALKYATNSSGSWALSTVDSVGSVGTKTSIALDSAGRPHISYYYTSARDLKYAYKNGASWVIRTIDSVGWVGSRTANAIDSADLFHIAYFDDSNDKVKYATGTAASWSIDTVDDVTYDNQVHIAVDSADAPHITYAQWTPSYRVMYAKKPGATWEIAQASASNLKPYYTRISLDSTDAPHIMFRDGGSLNYAKLSSGQWSSSVVEGPYVRSTGDLAIDRFDKLHAIYHDQQSEKIAYTFGVFAGTLTAESVTQTTPF